MSRSAFRLALVSVLVTLAATGLALAQQGRLHGSVVDEEGQPLVNVRIRLEPVDGEIAAATTLTNRRGNFLFSLVLPAVYRLRVESGDLALVAAQGGATDAAHEPVWTFDGRIRPDGSIEIEVREGWVLECDLMLGEAVAIVGEGGEETVLAPDAALDALTKQIQDGDCPGALAGLDALAAAKPEIAKVQYLRGFCLGSQGRGDDAVAALERTLELSPSFPGAALLEGQILRRLGRGDEAQPLFEREIGAAANDALVAEAWAELGILHRDAGRDEAAVEAFETVLERDPSRTAIWADLATLYTKLGRLPDAEQALSRAREGGKVDPAALMNVAISYFNAKDFESAERTLSRVVGSESVPRDELGLAYALLGQCQLRAGRREKAIASLEKSLDLSPDGKMAGDTRETLKSLGR